MQKMQRLIQSDGVDSSDFVGVIVAAMKEHLDADISFLSEFRHDHKVIRKLAGDGKAINTEDGSAFPLKDTYCYRMATGELPNLIQDAYSDNRVKNLAITKQLNIGTYVGVPVILPNGHTFGSLCCIYHHVETSIQPRDVRFMHVLADILGNHFGAEESAIEDRRLKYDRIEIDIVAEGIETAEDALALQLLGVRYGQGYYYGKPGPLPLKNEIDHA